MQQLWKGEVGLQHVMWEDWQQHPGWGYLGCALCVRITNEERVESLWVRIKGQAHTGDITVGVYYRPSDQEEEIDEAFYRQLQAGSQSQALVLMGDFNHPDISWEDHTARQAQSRRFLQSIDDNPLVDKDPEASWLVQQCWPGKIGLLTFWKGLNVSSQ